MPLAPMQDDVTTAAEIFERRKAMKEKFFGRANGSQNERISELQHRLDESIQRCADLESENRTQRKRIVELETALDKASRGEPNLPDIVTVRDVIDAVCVAFQVPRQVLLSTRRSKEVVVRRQIAFFMAHKFAAQSLEIIGRAFGGMDHTTVLHGIRKAEPAWALIEAGVHGKSLSHIARMMHSAWVAHYTPIDQEKYRRMAEKRKQAQAAA